jgi:hypothetical protein
MFIQVLPNVLTSIAQNCGKMGSANLGCRTLTMQECQDDAAKAFGQYAVDDGNC